MIAEAGILHPGLFSTIQDLGRFGFLQYGVPMSGAMDQYAATMANLFLNNTPSAAVLELTQLGPRMQFEAPLQIVLTGGDLSPSLNGTSVENNQVIQIGAGDILSFGKRITGCRSYLGVAGGFVLEEVLGSKSWYDGITTHAHLSKGMKLQYNQSLFLSTSTNAALRFQSDYLKQNQITVSKGPEYNQLPRNLQEQLVKRAFSIDKNNNRMAVQLVEPIANNLNPIITGPVIPGTVQLTPSGKMIVLMRDCQTTGGYPRVLQLSETGINVLSQKVMGDKIHFKMTS